MKKLLPKAPKIKLISVDQLCEGEYQARSFITQEKLESLALSVTHIGILQPLHVVKEKKGYVIKDGHRRWEAAKLANLAVVPCIVKDQGDTTDFPEVTVLNTMREPVNKFDLAKFWAHLVAEKGLTLEEIGKMHGCTKAWVSQVLSILKMDNQFQAAIQAGHIDVAGAREIYRLKSPKTRQSVLKDVIDSGASQRTLRSWVSQELARENPETYQPTSTYHDTKSPAPPSHTYPCGCCKQKFTGNELTSILVCANCRTPVEEAMKVFREMEKDG